MRVVKKASKKKVQVKVKHRPSLAFEAAWKARGHSHVAGIDEAGRGPLAGPVSVAAVILPDGFEHSVLTDSKQLPEHIRERIFEELMTTVGIIWTHVMVDVPEVDELNILRATHVGMRRAVEALVPCATAVLIDGLPVPNFPVPHEALVEGDSRSLSIAAASIIAKVMRDRHMHEVARLYPQYGFERHKGYGTAAHLEALRVHGPCPVHRRSFSPVAQLTFTFEEC